jgi:TPR repeat protein
MIYKPMIAATVVVFASCCFSAALAAPAKEVRSPPALVQPDNALSAYERKDFSALSRMAAAGDARAQSNLGLMYGNGTGVAQDYVQAHKWFNLGATSGDTSAVKNRDLVASKMTPAQIAEAQRLASAWRKK